MSARRARSKSQCTGKQTKRSQGAHPGNEPGAGPKMQSAEKLQFFDEQWLREMRRGIRIVSRQLDELEVLFRAFDVLESKRAVRDWFNSVVPTLGARPIDLCQTAHGRQAVLRELGRIEHGVHS